MFGCHTEVDLQIGATKVQGPQRPCQFPQAIGEVFPIDICPSGFGSTGKPKVVLEWRISGSRLVHPT
ncbi:MAG: hypothetical protein A3H29_01790 [Acidobacteria bacterium RIFCSPLOWO2_02_FULL_67_21]|nr:MAG: hypothetical protein A3H29_01790 [Acidobacteria bacterium RIFCSPLOWO2_02_FULL_67_21]